MQPTYLTDKVLLFACIILTLSIPVLAYLFTNIKASRLKDKEVSGNTITLHEKPDSCHFREPGIVTIII